MPDKDYEKEINDLISSVLRMSSLMQNSSTPQEQEQMQGKKATFYIKGINKRYTFEITGSKVQLTESMENVTTYCVVSSGKVFLETIDKILSGDVSAFQRAMQRGDFVMKGPQSLHDQLMWKKGLDRLADILKVYGKLV